MDYGAVFSGYNDNYSWGTLSLASGNNLYLYDGNETAGGALYVGAVQFGDGLDQISSIYGNGFNIYYRSDLAENLFLGGQTYALSGGGVLAPTVVPEPISTILFITGGVLLGGRRLLKKKSIV